MSNKAAITNPALKPFGVLHGKWKADGISPQVAGAILQRQSSFQWIESADFLIWTSRVDYRGFPKRIAVFGIDYTAEKYSMLYYAERKSVA